MSNVTTAKETNWKEQAQHAWALVKENARLVWPSARFLTTCEAHTYAYSVAANAILALVPFLVLLLTVAHLMQSQPAEDMIYTALRQYLPIEVKELARLKAELGGLTHGRGVQIFSFLMLAISSSGVFLPFEVALNGVWGFKKNRSYLGNQLMSLALVAACAVLAYAGVVFAAVFKAALADPLAPVQTHPGINAALTFLIVRIFAVPITILSFWIIFWWLPNGRVPAMQVFPAAFYTGVLAEVFKTVFGWIVPLLDLKAVYGYIFWIPVTLLIWAYAGALLLLFGASLSARGVVKIPSIRFHHHKPPEPAAVAAGGASQ
jgi:YihY family inner membrane protein